MKAKVKPPASICNRQFNWSSSSIDDPRVLDELDEQMAWFYSQQEGRSHYQEMLENQKDEPEIEGSIEYSTLGFIANLNPSKVLEVGCSSGRVYRRLCQREFTGSYSGIEVADYIIEQNRFRHAEATWKCATAYEIPFSDSDFDLCFSFFVLEHLVYPEKALKEMLRVVKPGGSLLLVFPDFIASKRLPSQLYGFSPGSASEKLRQGRIFDAFLSLYDTKFRLPNALRKSTNKIGSFPINLNPICLSFPDFMGADIDAVYIASKQEVASWAESLGYQVKYPFGTQKPFEKDAIIVISK